MTPDDIIRLLDELGKRLQPTGQHVFELAVRQVNIEGWLYLGVGALSVLVSIVLIGVIVWMVKQGHEEAPFLAGMGATFFLALSGYLISVGLTNLLNPEYQAIVHLLDALP